MKTHIDKDELYPFYSDGNYGVEVELTDSESRQVEEAWKAFNEMQALLERKLNEAE